MDTDETLPPMQPEPRLNDPPQASSWPVTVGVISIVFGALGLLCYGCNSATTIAQPWMMGMVPEDQRPPAPSGILLGIQIFQLCVAFLLSLWLLIAGIGLSRRRAWARNQHVAWAVAKLLVVVASTTVSILFAPQFVKQINDQMSAGGRTPPFTITDTMFIGFAFIGLIFYLIWPVFILSWFARQRVKDEVAAWAEEARAMI